MLSAVVTTGVVSTGLWFVTFVTVSLVWAVVMGVVVLAEVVTAVAKEVFGLLVVTSVSSAVELMLVALVV